jgi:hypothetical protein
MFAFATRRQRTERMARTIKNFVELEISEENKKFFS